MNRVYYLGSFPPPYGGVTVKNKLLCDLLGKEQKIHSQKSSSKIDTIINLGKALVLGKKFCIGIGSNNNLFLVTTLISILNIKAMKRSIVFVMGGSMADTIENKPMIIKQFCRYRHLFVETEGMLNKLHLLGIDNTSLLPNCRLRPQKEYIPTITKFPLRCVFFSYVSPEKGADLVVGAAKLLTNIRFDFYGRIDAQYEAEFKEDIEQLKNVTYNGVFNVSGDNVYEKLHEYDLLLLPTRWANEGMPGVLVEAKIVAVPAIVSNICYNAEIIEDHISGMVLKKNNVYCLMEAIQSLNKDRVKLQQLKQGALTSAERYYIETYIDEIAAYLAE